MNYEKAARVIKINYGLILQISTMALILMVILRNEKAMYSLKNNPDFNVGEAPKKVCYHSIQSIINGNPSSNYYTSEIFDYLKDNPKIFNFKSNDTVSDVVFRDDTCKVLVSSEDSVRGFLIPLEKSMSNPLYYAVKNISEVDEQIFKLDESKE